MMQILKLRASFGKLHGELELKEGMNLLCLPNEAGKSTWSAFLVAMLYGIDTSERANAANQGLPVKERYRPWDGSPMEGSIEFLWQGRHITVERSTTGKIPMGNFRAYETSSGIPVTELTGENCGRVLCGVERGVFERTAFIRQLGLAVTEDAALEKRLGALVSTGEDGAKTYLELEKELRSRKNKLSGRSGQIPRLLERKEALKQSLDQLHSLQDKIMQLSAKREEAAKEEAEASMLLERIAKAKQAQKQAGLAVAEEKLKQQEDVCRRLEETAAVLPPMEQLNELQRQLDHAQRALQTAKMDAAFGAREAIPPAPVQGFPEPSAPAVLEQAERDRLTYAQLRNTPKPKGLFPVLLPIIVLLVGLGAFLTASLLTLPPLKTVGIIFTVLGVVGLIAGLLVHRSRLAHYHQQQQLAEKILLRYGLEDCAVLWENAQRYARELEAYESEKLACEEEKRQLGALLTGAQRHMDELLAQVRAFAPNCTEEKDCREALFAALRTHEQVLTQKRALETQSQQYEAMRLLLDVPREQETDMAALALDETKISYEQRNAHQKRQRYETELAQNQGVLSMIGDGLQLAAELESVEEALQRAAERSEAIDLALDGLKYADETLRSRFSPQITREAGKLLAELTGGKYPALLLEPDLRLSVREEDGTVMRPVAAMSCGTADQMYLALRLAMCRQLLSEKVPLILDDALVNFDEKRAENAISLLKKEAEKRQVILFTCRNFELGD